MNTGFKVDREALIDQITNIVYRNLDDESKNWLQGKLSTLQQQPVPKDLYLTFSAMTRFLGKSVLQLSTSDKQAIEKLRPGLSLEDWNVTQAGRVLSVCCYKYADAKDFNKITDQLFTTAEVNELVALYSALPLLPYPDSLKFRASEGIRTNMSVVFDAVVLNNPYPSEWLDQGAWNQMVLKALFMERPLFRIYGLEDRCNLELSKMISNYAHERWAAGRETSPEMWRPVGDQGTVSIYQDLEKLIMLDDPNQQAAAVLTAKGLNTREAQSFLDKNQSIADEVEKNQITWDEIGKRWWSKRNQE